MHHFNYFYHWGDPGQRKAGWIATLGFGQNPDQRHFAFSFDLFDDFKYRRFVASLSCIILYWHLTLHLVHLDVDYDESESDS